MSRDTERLKPLNPRRERDLDVERRGTAIEDGYELVSRRPRSRYITSPIPAEDADRMEDVMRSFPIMGLDEDGDLD